MERIGTLLRRLKLDPENLAARGHDGAHSSNRGDGPAPGGKTDPSMLSRGEEAQASNSMNGKDPMPESGEGIGSSKGQQHEGGRKRLSTETRMRLVLPVGKGMRSVNRQQERPTPALRRPMLIVIEGGRHASTG